jgi:hypothetical protein
MTATYTYSIQNDFPSRKVATDRLQQEILASAIVTAVDHLNTSGDECDIFFKGELSSGDKTLLDGLVATHSGEPLPAVSQPVTLDGVPCTQDGKPQMVPNLLPPWTSLYFAGQGDTREGGVGAGQPFVGSSDAAGDTTIEWIFTDQVFLVGGSTLFSGAELGDWVDYFVVAPGTLTGEGATPVTLVPYAGGNAIVPNPEGSARVDLTKVSLVPTPGSGYWDWDSPIQGYGTVTPNYEGSGGYTLFDFEVGLGHPIVKMHILGSNKVEFLMPNITPMAIIPQWKHRVIIHNVGHAGLRVTWLLLGGRGGPI